MPKAGDAWSREENELTVASYLEMLGAERRDEPYVKAEYWRELREQIPARSKGAIEFKYGNISAVLIDLQFPPIDGYKPYSNYQADLYEEVQRQLQRRDDLVTLVNSQVEAPARALLTPFDSLDALLDEPPTDHTRRTSRERRVWYERPVQRAPFDFLQREARNASLGDAGEELVLRFEQARLVAAGKERLAAKVEHVARTRGANAGFDILSFETTGRERLVEVKTTRFGKHTPFFVSQNEVLTSDSHAEQFWLYRVFAFDRDTRLFQLPGPVRLNCDLDPAIYRANVRQQP